MTTDTPHADDRDVLVITVREDGASLYEEARDAIEALDRGESVEQPDSVTFPNATMLTQTFTERTLGLLQVIADTGPESIRETARRVDRDVKNVHEELARLETMGVIHFAEEGRSKRPVFPTTNSLLPCHSAAPMTQPPRHHERERPADALREGLLATPQRPFGYTKIRSSGRDNRALRSSICFVAQD
jgi:predicted transcriptional regulator